MAKEVLFRRRKASCCVPLGLLGDQLQDPGISRVKLFVHNIADMANVPCMLPDAAAYAMPLDHHCRAASAPLAWKTQHAIAYTRWHTQGRYQPSCWNAAATHVHPAHSKAA